MDLWIRYWDKGADMVSTRYCDSTCLGKAAATDVFEKFNSIAKNLDETKFFQVMSDGPNVNKLFLNLLAETREEEQRSRMVDLGTCGMHTLHNGFQHGEKANVWEVKSLLNAMHKTFDESPARRADYEKITTSIESDFALQFCSHRWIENARVAERAQDIWEKYLQIIDYWKTLPKSKQPRQSKPRTNKSDHILLK